MKKLLIVAVMMAGTVCCELEASPWTTPVKTGVKKVMAQGGGHVGGKVVVRGGTALAKATAERAAAKTAVEKAAEKVAKSATPWEDSGGRRSCRSCRGDA